MRSTYHYVYISFITNLSTICLMGIAMKDAKLMQMLMKGIEYKTIGRKVMQRRLAISVLINHNVCYMYQTVYTYGAEEYFKYYFSRQRYDVVHENSMLECFKRLTHKLH